MCVCHMFNKVLTYLLISYIKCLIDLNIYSFFRWLINDHKILRQFQD